MGNQLNLNKVTPAGVLITLGIVFGDIGTSPLYVMKAISGERIITQELVLSSISAVFWTLTVMTTLKYVLITLRADNRGEGGILSLYALVRRHAKWLVAPAMVGGAALLADGMITPPISVSSAIEGLKLYNPEIEVVPIVVVIIVLLFLFQRLGTSIVGKFFGPTMVIWFSMLATLGISQIIHFPEVFKALNPAYVLTFLQQPGGFWLLGAVFLCTTGAEALYSDLGHCGRKNIQVSWSMVKICLLLNYFGQGAWMLQHLGTPLDGRNPFYEIVPSWFLIFAITIATAAAIIASQALISGSFTLISEAVRLNLWPKIKIIYPTVHRGQLYIPSINYILLAGCIVVVLYFRRSENMEAAYGLAITITMLMTTVLLTFYLFTRRLARWIVWSAFFLFASIELCFFFANLLKFTHGGWFSLVVGILLASVMYIWFRGRKIKNRFVEFVNLDEKLPLLKEMSQDESIPKYSTNLVYLTSADFAHEIEQKIIYSIMNKQPKRADTYWFIHVDVQDDPHRMDYRVLELVPQKVFKVEFRLGFRVAPRVNKLFRIVVEDMMKHGEVDILSRYPSLRNQNIIGDFRFVVIERVLTYDMQLPPIEKFIMISYITLKNLGISEEKAFGLDTSSVTTEKVPLFINPPSSMELKRIKPLS